MIPVLSLVCIALSSAAITSAGFPNTDDHDQATISRADPATALQVVKISSKIIKREPDSIKMNSMQSDLIKDFQFAQNRIQEFYETLQSFVVNGNFNTTAFDAQVHSLGLQLAVVGGVASKFRTVSEPFSQQLDFVSNAFNKMADSRIDLYLYNISTAVGHRWLYKITELNVRLLTMHDSSGHLDLSRKETFTQLFCCWRNLQVWGGRFSKMDNVSDMLSDAYDIQNREAEKTIRALARQLPGDAGGC